MPLPDRGVLNAALVAVHDTFKPSAGYPNARPASPDDLSTAGGGFSTKVGTDPGGEPVNVGLLAIAPQYVPKEAVQAKEAGASSKDTLTGTVWLDFKPGGGGEKNVIDTGEKGLPGITVEAVRDGKTVAKATIRRVRFEISGSKRAENWHPFQVICENCGRIGTTEVVAYDGKEVEYHCRPNLVKWAQGCGHHGKMSPFGGNGKLPWNIEWVAKWVTFPVGVEGAGKDHSTAGGSREVSEATMRAIYPGSQPPFNIPYEFFLVGGRKMSSSKGVGALARDMADFLARIRQARRGLVRLRVSHHGVPGRGACRECRGQFGVDCHRSGTGSAAVGRRSPVSALGFR